MAIYPANSFSTHEVVCLESPENAESNLSTCYFLCHQIYGGYSSYSSLFEDFYRTPPSFVPFTPIQRKTMRVGIKFKAIHDYGLFFCRVDGQ